MMSEGRSPERLCGAAACGRDLMAKPCYSLYLAIRLAIRSWATWARFTFTLFMSREKITA